jgi:hypothetical protein
MYVICAGMYRACSTWQYEVIAHLLETHWNGFRLGYLTGEKFAAFDDVWADKPGCCVLKSHEENPRFTATIAEGRAIAVYSYRDIRDVVFSLMHKRRVTFETLLRQGMIHQILVNDRYWRSRPDVLCQRYETLVADPVAGVDQLAAHLGLALSPGESAEIAREYSFQANRQRMLKMGQRLKAEGINLDDPANVQYYDCRTLLHWNHLREGRVGNWRDLASPRQRAILARLCNPWLAERGYETDTRVAPVGEGRVGPMLRATSRVREGLELGGGRLACLLRCASLRHPKTARFIKLLLGISTDHVPGRPIESLSASSARLDAGEPIGVHARPHIASRSQRMARSSR